MKTHQKRLLDRGKIEKLVAALRSIESDNPEVTEKARTEADYFERNDSSSVADHARCVAVPVPINLVPTSRHGPHECFTLFEGRNPPARGKETSTVVRK
jgi:hypothetical protein